ncbi:MAG: hypothetical protein Q9160_004717 [Pyrenula sp. 1 TL-2023]
MQTVTSTLKLRELIVTVVSRLQISRSLFHPKGNTTRKDPPAHWYEAQLIHYGLPPSKNKGTAVKRLLDAVNSGNLSELKHITTLENSLKKQWDANDRQTKKEIKDAAAQGKSTGQSKKRKADNATSAAATPTGAVPPKKSKTTTSAAKQNAAAPSRGAKKSVSVAKAPSINHTASPPPRPKQTARRGGGFAAVVSRQNSVANREARRRFSRGVSRKDSVSGKATAATKSSTPKAKPAPKASIKKEPKPSIKRERSPSSDAEMINAPVYPPAPLGYISGHYTISCPFIEDEWPDSIPEDGLSLTLCLDTPRIWVSYDLGMFEGVALVPERPLKASTEEFPLYMRGRDTSEGQMFFDDQWVGEIVFSGGGEIEGFVNLPSIGGMQRFYGSRQPGPPHVGVSAWQLMDEWEGYNEDRCEEERVNRWR